MQAYPHHYVVAAEAGSESNVQVTGDGLVAIESAPPAEFDGPGDQWSPEDLLVASVADCLILTFRAIARANKLEWDSLKCETTGVLDKVDRVTRFTEFRTKATLRVPAGTDVAKCERLLDRAEQVCLITSSLIAENHLEVSVEVADQ